jgi:hypothetical protein
MAGERHGRGMLCVNPPLRSSSSFLRLLPCLPVSSIPPCIFPSVTRCRRQFLCRMWPIQFAFCLRISCTIFLCSLTLSNEEHDHNKSALLLKTIISYRLHRIHMRNYSLKLKKIFIGKILLQKKNVDLKSTYVNFGLLLIIWKFNKELKRCWKIADNN